MNLSRIFLALPMLVASHIAFAQPAEADWEADVRKFDSEYWQAFNQCKVAKLAQLNTSDLEFYHDVAGAMTGRGKFATAFKNNICGNPDLRVRREAVADSVRVFPMRDKGKLYGAIISGEHLFFNSEKGRAEVQTGQARFTHMLVLDKGAWKVSRVLSFDHAPAKYDNKRVGIPLPVPGMKALAGDYTSKDKVVFKVSPAESHLAVTVGGSAMKFYPMSANGFFLKERDITITFLPREGGKGRRLVVREVGEIVEEASAPD